MASSRSTDGAWLADSVVDLAGAMVASGREDLARRLARAAEAATTQHVGVVLLARGTEPAVCVGSTSRAAEFAERCLAFVPAAVAELGRGAEASDGFVALDGWESYFSEAQRLELTSVQSVVLRDGDEALGVIEVFATGSAPPEVERLLPLAKVAAALLVNQTARQEAVARADQLAHALDSRVVIEQAKGMLAQHAGIPLDSAFESLRRRARDSRRRLTDLCASVTFGETDLDAIRIDYVAMSAARREQLRARALDRWRTVSAAALGQHDRAMESVSRSVELRVELDHARALRDANALGRAIDKQFRAPSTPTPGKRRPRVILGESAGPVTSFVTDTLSRDQRFDFTLADGSTSAETLGTGIVEQPDLLILGPDASHPLSSDFLTELHQFCPDSRTLVVVGRKRASLGVGIDKSDIIDRCDGIVVLGDARGLMQHAAELCGVRVGRQG